MRHWLDDPELYGWLGDPEPYDPELCGFRWGPLRVERTFEYRGRRLLRIETDGGRTLEVIVSPRGNRVSASLDGRLLTYEEGA